MLFVSAAPERDEHRGPYGHPERPERLNAALRGLARAGLADEGLRLAPRQATRLELERAHTPAYLDFLEQACRAGGGQLDPDTAVVPGSWRTALEAVGGFLAVVEALEEAGEGVGFCAHRPPGHHATQGQAMGFCLLNTVAVTAAMLADRQQRVMVLDWDVHHGNGTEAIFWDDPRVLYVSLHQSPLYPGTGAAGAVGGPAARGSNLNIPVPPGTTGDVLLHALDSVVGPVTQAFGPQWLLVSCGFDAHRSDPLANLALSAGDFARLAVAAADWVPPGRVALALEGGYDLEAIEASTAAVLSSLLGAPVPNEAPTSGGPGREEVEGAAKVYRQLSQ